MENMELYNSVRKCPQDALREIKAGRLKGKSDINPQWRIQMLTKKFGIYGFGWKVKTIRSYIEEGANGEKIAFVDIEMYVKMHGEWSEPMEGSGGSKFISKETNGLYTSDEAFKMAKTDAISVCCKMLGFAADVYWQNGSKYYESNYENNYENKNITKVDFNKKNITEEKISAAQLKLLCTLASKRGLDDEKLKKSIKKSYNIDSKNDLTKYQFNQVVKFLETLPEIERNIKVIN